MPSPEARAAWGDLGLPTPESCPAAGGFRVPRQRKGRWRREALAPAWCSPAGATGQLGGTSEPRLCLCSTTCVCWKRLLSAKGRGYKQGWPGPGVSAGSGHRGGGSGRVREGVGSWDSAGSSWSPPGFCPLSLQRLGPGLCQVKPSAAIPSGTKPFIQKYVEVIRETAGGAWLSLRGPVVYREKQAWSQYFRPCAGWVVSASAEQGPGRGRDVEGGTSQVREWDVEAESWMWGGIGQARKGGRGGLGGEENPVRGVAGGEELLGDS